MDPRGGALGHWVAPELMAESRTFSLWAATRLAVSTVMTSLHATIACSSGYTQTPEPLRHGHVDEDGFEDVPVKR